MKDVTNSQECISIAGSYLNIYGTLLDPCGFYRACCRKLDCVLSPGENVAVLLGTITGSSAKFYNIWFCLLIACVKHRFQEW